MASTGQVVVNAATGERVVFQTLARDSAGELLRLDVFFAPGSAARAMHVHPHQEERFEILKGSLRFRVGRETKVAKAGDVIVVPAGTPHLPTNVGEAEAHCVAEFRPALNSETFFENAFALLSARGPRTSLPMILELAELLSHYRREVQATPAPMRVLTTLAAPIGKVVGYKPRFSIEA
jgi:quercetin dioxygenase-like cupin family protein